jgi:5-methylcytosine-specific restriction endonuclease McrA
MDNKSKLESISTISDDELLRRLSALLKKSRRVEAELVAHIGEVDRRRLYASRASSMFVYCVEVLHLSEAEAYLRITVARASRKHPVLLEMLADGRLHLSGIAKLAQHLTEDNRNEILARAAGKSKRQIDELVAELSPKRDVAATMRKIPERREKQKPVSSQPELRPDGVKNETSAPAEAEPASTPVPDKAARVEPTAPARYKVTFTVGAKLRDKLERLRALMNSDDLAAVIDEAVTEKLERLESKRYGKTKTPRKGLEETDTSPASRYIPAPVRRAVYARDGGQCSFINEGGRRCTERRHLEFHHIQPYGRGGRHSPENVVLLCRSHNLYLAEREYGKEFIGRFRNLPGRVSEPAAAYHCGKSALLN